VPPGSSSSPKPLTGNEDYRAALSRAAAGVVEIRVHGVSGTPPQDVLCSTWAAQVAGDASAPIFQPADQFGRTIPGTDLPHVGGSVPRQVEAYHWGEMTSGGWSKAIWALLAPFALVNVAHWMLPAGARKGIMHDLIGIIEALLRLAGLLLTALFMTQAAILVMDVVVGQCPAEPGKCLSSAHLGWLWAHQRLLSIAGALVLVAVLGVINHISVIKWALRGRKAKARRGDGDVLADDDSFYDGDADAPMLRATHLTAGLSVVVVLILGGTHRPSGWWLPVWAVAGVLLLAAVAAVLFFLRHPRDAMPDKPVPKSAARVGPALALALLTVTAVWGPTASAAQAKRDSTHMPLPLPGSDDVVGLAMIALDCVVALIVAALVPVVISKWGSRRDTPTAFRPFALGGFAAPVTILGGLLGAGLGAGYTYIAASCLGGKCSAVFSQSYGANSPFQLPASYESLSELWAVSGIVVVAGAVVLVLAFLTSAARSAKNVLVPSYLRPAGIVQGSPSGAGQPFKVALSWQLPRWRVLSARILTAMSAVIAIAALLCLEAQWARTKTPLLRPLRFLLDRGFLARPASALSLTAHRPFLAAVGAYVVTVITLAFLLRVYNAARRPDSARALGILWDLASYWPRAAHPFVPPCYAQRAVPDLVERAHRYIEEGHTVVLSAHSQGSLITLAAALRMKACYPDSCKYLGLVMAGSQLQWAYPRAFPAVVDLHAYQRVLGDLKGRWYVLVRGTDPLGGPVLSWNLNENDGKLTACELTKVGTPGEEGPQAADPHGPGLWIAGHDWWISDPMPAASADCGFALPAFSTSTQRHSGYWSHPQWDRAVARAAGLKPVGVRPHPADETASETRFWARLRSRISAWVRTLTTPA
jgi:hypothetical protein